MRTTKFTNLGRELDPGVPTNLAIIGLSPLVGVIFAIAAFVRDPQFQVAIWAGFHSSLTFFLGWAIAREYDPDNPNAAFLAASGTLIPHTLDYRSNLLPLVWALLFLRIINRSTGVGAKSTDLVAVVSLGIWLSWSFNWIVGFLSAGALTVDGLLGSKDRIRFVLAILATAASFATLKFGSDALSLPTARLRYFITAALLVVLWIPHWMTSAQLTSKCDYTNEPIDAKRVRWAQIFLLISTLLLGTQSGNEGYSIMLAAGTVVAASAVYRVLSGLYQVLA